MANELADRVYNLVEIIKQSPEQDYNTSLRMFVDRLGIDPARINWSGNPRNVATAIVLEFQTRIRDWTKFDYRLTEFAADLARAAQQAREAADLAAQQNDALEAGDTCQIIYLTYGRPPKILRNALVSSKPILPQGELFIGTEAYVVGKEVGFYTNEPEDSVLVNAAVYINSQHGLDKTDSKCISANDLQLKERKGFVPKQLLLIFLRESEKSENFAEIKKYYHS